MNRNLTCGVYGIKDKEGNIIYIGQSLRIENRVQDHKNKLPEYHNYEVLEVCNKELLKERELYWINYYINAGNNIINKVLVKDKVKPIKQSRVKKNIKGINDNKKAILLHFTNKEMIELKHMAINEYKDLKNYLQDHLIELSKKNKK